MTSNHFSHMKTIVKIKTNVLILNIGIQIMTVAFINFIMIIILKMIFSVPAIIYFQMVVIFIIEIKNQSILLKIIDQIKNTLPFIILFMVVKIIIIIKHFINYIVK